MPYTEISKDKDQNKTIDDISVKSIDDFTSP